MQQYLNHPIAAFLFKIAAICGMWFVLYDMWLLPDGRLDEAISQHVASISASILESAGYALYTDGRDVILQGTSGIRIADGCNGISAIGLFVGFALAYPGSWRARTWFIPLGVVLLYVTNVLRVIALALSQVYWPAAFDALHGFSLTMIFYVVIFALWVMWMNISPYSSISDQSA